MNDLWIVSKLLRGRIVCSFRRRPTPLFAWWILSFILQIILLILLRTPNRGYLKRIFNSNIFGNLELQYLILPGRKPLYTALGSIIAVWCVQNKIKFIYYDLPPLLFFASFMKNQQHDVFAIIDNEHFTLSEKNFSLSQFSQIK